MRIAEPAIVGKAAFAAKLAMMSESTIDVATSLPCGASDGTRLMFQYKDFTWTETLAVVIVTVFGSGAVACEMIAVTAFA